MVTLVQKKPSNSSYFISLLHKCKHEKELRRIHARIIIDETEEKEQETFLWNSLLKLYSHFCYRTLEPLYLYQQFTRSDVVADKFTFPFVLKACANARSIKIGLQIHCQIVKSRHVLDRFVQGSLVDMYAKCGSIQTARICFDLMQYKNSVSWNSMMDGYIKHGELNVARQLFNQIPIHEKDLFSWNVMIDGYGKSGLMKLAHELFDEMPERDLVSWNSMLDGYAKSGNMGEAKKLFDTMSSKDDISWGIMVSGYVNSNDLEMAHCILDLMPHGDFNLAPWNALIDGYARSGSINNMLELFGKMRRKNLVSWNIVLNALAKCGNMEMACQMFNKMPQKDIISWNTMLDGYAKHGDTSLAKQLFNSMPLRDVVSWNSMMSAYKDVGCPEKCIHLFHHMLTSETAPDCSTLAIVLSAIAHMGVLTDGRWVHDYIARNRISLNGNVGVALIDMYSKCGDLKIARDIFWSIPFKNIDHWNSIITGQAVHGHGNHAIQLFEELQQSSLEPDEISFIGVLTACSHAGLVDQGWYYFNLMTLRYKIHPNIKHFGCMVDLLSRAGHLKEASLLVKNIPIKSNDVVWRALLGSCKIHGNMNIGQHAVTKLMDLEVDDTSSYSLLCGMYGAAGRWDDVVKIRKVMKEKGIKKIAPGCSSIESGGSALIDDQEDSKVWNEGTPLWYDIKE